MPIKHAFTSAKSDGGDATLVRPSNWNADHTSGIGILDTSGNPDIHPASPNTEDDEFEAGSLDAKWTKTGSGIASLSNSRYILNLATAAGDETIYQAYVPGASTAFELRAKFTGAIFTGSSTDYYGFMVTDSGGSMIEEIDMRSGPTANSDQGPQQAGAQGIADTFYLRIARDASNVYTFGYSADGLLWANFATHTNSATVARIYIRWGSTSKQTWKGACVDWIRRT